MAVVVVVVGVVPVVGTVTEVFVWVLVYVTGTIIGFTWIVDPLVDTAY